MTVLYPAGWLKKASMCVYVAVQEERLNAEKGEMEAESTTAAGEMLIDNILSAEMRIDSNSDSSQNVEDIDTLPPYSWNSICNQLSHALVDWALAVPHFTDLSPDDQLMILKAGTVSTHVKFDTFMSVILHCVQEKITPCIHCHNSDKQC